MKLIRIDKWLLCGLCAWLCSSTIMAQQPSRPTIFDALQATEPGAGVVLVTQTPEIASLVGVKSIHMANNARIVNGFAVISGYRIQVYSGNLRNSKAIATHRRNQVNALYPELLPTVEYDAPFWRVRVGNFVEQSEAQAKMHELKKAFPSFAREMYIIRSQVRLDPQDL
ncbi:SPOR domain-containing protein [uncultured Porphyromonas sp.]|uniref:SPOR domain-containing protein n=2 Tax=uncultured Porphyromonas sp. TaxID=159274 RepID=UPI00261EE312|nr:SPOR domain-containing protein [uncultured Porphyromonas sp.]